METHIYGKFTIYKIELLDAGDPEGRKAVLADEQSPTRREKTDKQISCMNSVLEREMERAILL